MDKADYEQEQALVNRLKEEMRQERDMQMEKRRQEKEYLQLMIEENEKHKEQQEKSKQKEVQEDVRAQAAYSSMLAQQEDDRNDEMNQREKRAQEFMGKMADTVLKEMEMKQRHEDDMIRQFEMDKEQQERVNDQLAYKKMKDDQQRMREELAQQVADKGRRETMEKDYNDEQAKMWALDRENYERQENDLNHKIKDINMENRKFLESQMQERDAAKKQRMNFNEHLLNKQLLREINDQRRPGESGQGSRHSQVPI